MANKKDMKRSNEAFIEGIKKAGQQFFMIALDFFEALGLFGIYSGSMILKSSKKFYKKYLKQYVLKIDALGLRCVKFFSKIGRAISFRFYMFAKFFVNAKNVIVGGYHSKKDASVGKKYLGALVAFMKGVKNNKQVFVTALNYSAPVIAITLFASLVSSVSSLNFAVSVEYNGEHVGYIENESVFESAEAKLQERMIYLEGEEIIDDIPKFAVAIVNDQPLKTDTQMTDTIIQSAAGDIVKATGLIVDGEFLGAVKDGQKLETELELMKDEYRTDTADEEVDFVKDVRTEPGLFLAQNVVAETEIIEKVTTQEQKDLYYEVVSGDTPIIIAAKNDMILDDVVALNSDLLTNCKIGKQVLVQQSQSFLPVVVTRTETYSQNIPFKTTYTDSNELYKGREKTTQVGAIGSEVISAKVEYVDGAEVGRTVVSSRVMEAPVEQQVSKGTLDLPQNINVHNGKLSGYGFMWPTTGGYISQYYGGRNNHNAIDYAYRGNGYGQPIYAALEGTVVFSGYQGSYGKLVILESPGGVETWYAHCSELLVSVGQKVIQGQQIAKVGSTGTSTGNHLHFRVIINGVQKDPMNYLP